MVQLFIRYLYNISKLNLHASKYRFNRIRNIQRKVTGVTLVGVVFLILSIPMKHDRFRNASYRRYEYKNDTENGRGKRYHTVCSHSIPQRKFMKIPPKHWTHLGLKYHRQSSTISEPVLTVFKSVGHNNDDNQSQQALDRNWEQSNRSRGNPWQGIPLFEFKLFTTTLNIRMCVHFGITLMVAGY